MSETNEASEANEANEVNVSPGQTILDASECNSLCEAYVTANNLEVGGCCEYQTDWDKCVWVDGSVVSTGDARYAAECSLGGKYTCMRKKMLQKYHTKRLDHQV